MRQNCTRFETESLWSARDVEPWSGTRRERKNARPTSLVLQSH
jgi:hypothetical protein